MSYYNKNWCGFKWYYDKKRKILKMLKTINDLFETDWVFEDEFARALREYLGDDRFKKWAGRLSTHFNQGGK